MEYYLVQQASIDHDVNENDTILKTLNFAYMGSSEFEGGALTRALANLITTKDPLKFGNLQNGKDTMYLCRVCDEPKLIKLLRDLESARWDLIEIDIHLNEMDSVMFGIDEGMEFFAFRGTAMYNSLVYRAEKSRQVLVDNNRLPATSVLNPLFVS